MLVRPYLDRGRSRAERSRAAEPSRPAGTDEPGGRSLRDEVRPYLITGGRTSGSSVTLAMESVVVVSDAARAGRSERIAFERARVLAECGQPRSVAEVAAHLGVPLMVALIVVGDLVEEGLLVASTTAASDSGDVTFLERLIDGVSAL